MVENKDTSFKSRFIQSISFLWLDDKTGRQSDTTLRTWILFFVFVAYTIHVAFFDSEITSADIELLQLLSISFLGMGGLYLGKRTFVNDRIEKPHSHHANHSYFDESPIWLHESKYTKPNKYRQTKPESIVDSIDPVNELEKRGIHQ